MEKEKNLSKEFRETMDEAKAMLTVAALRSCASTMEGEELMQNITLLQLLNRMMTLACDMFEKQDKLMDKMDKAMDKYLTSNTRKE